MGSGCICSSINNIYHRKSPKYQPCTKARWMSRENEFIAETAEDLLKWLRSRVPKHKDGQAVSLITIRDPSAFRTELQHSEAHKAAFDQNTGEKMGKNTQREREKSLSRHYYNQDCFKTKKQRRWKKEKMKSLQFAPCCFLFVRGSIFNSPHFIIHLLYLFIYILHSVFWHSPLPLTEKKQLRMGGWNGWIMGFGQNSLCAE